MARLDLEPGYISQCVAKRPHSRFIIVAKDVDEVAAAAVTELNNPAVGLSRRFRRAYPLGESMAHVLGIVGRDGVGREGLELALDKHLTGQDGQRVGMRDARIELNLPGCRLYDVCDVTEEASTFQKLAAEAALHS